MTDTPTITTPRVSLGIGQIFGRSFGLFFRHFWGYLGLMILPALVVGVLFGIAAGLTVLALPELTGDFRTVLANDSVTVILALVAIVVVVFASYAFSLAAIAKGTMDAATDDGMRFGVALRTGWKRLLPLMGLSLVLLLIFYVPAVVLFSIFSLMGEAGALLGLIVGAIWLVGCAVWLVAAIPVHTIERNGLGAIGRSIKLTEGYRLAILGLLVLAFLAMFGISLLLTLPSILLGFAGTAGLVISQILQSLIQVALMTIFVIATTLIYLRLVEIKEGSLSNRTAEVFD